MQAESTRHQLEVEEEKSAKLMAYISQMELKMYFYAIPPVTPPVTRVEREVVDMVCGFTDSQYNFLLFIYERLYRINNNILYVFNF